MTFAGALNAFSQDSASLAHRVKQVDSTARNSNQALTQLQSRFRHSADSLQTSYRAPITLLNQKMARLRHQKDSLSALKLPTSSVTKEIKSLQKEQQRRLREMDKRMNELKKKTLGQLDQLQLPPDAKKELARFTQSVNRFSVPRNFFQSPLNTNLPGSLNLNTGTLPSGINAPNGNLPNVNTAVPGTQELTKVEGALSKDVQQAQQLSTLNEKTVEQDAVKAAQQNSAVNGIVKEQSQVQALEKQVQGLNPEKGLPATDKQLPAAVNHFAGKEKELQAAMGQISKLKEKYSNVTSLSELPKRPPNPLKGKPWQERLIPGLNYFVQGRQATLVDLTPMVGWRFNPKLTISLGWNERLAVRHGSVSTHQQERVFGVRTTAQYLWQHGIIFQVSPELMWAYVPMGGTLDTRHQKAIFGVYSGVRKNFPIYKMVSGYSEVLYHFSQVPGENIYGDRLVFRFGFEVKLKKKEKKK